MRTIRALRLINPLQTRREALIEWRYITAFISEVLALMSRQALIDNEPTPFPNFTEIHIKTERRTGIYKTHKVLASLPPDHRREVIKDIQRRRRRAYNIFLRTTSTQEFSE